LATFSIQRRQFFTGKKLANNNTSAPLPFRPPWAIAETHFDDTCTNCGDCIHVCPTDLLSFGSGRLPTVDFSNNECTFCGKCATICEANALDKQDQQNLQQPAWDLIVTISDKCLAMRRITCRSCSEMCETEAIQFRLEVGGKSTPQLSLNDCTGCGACIAPCPVDAIQISRKNSQ
jgi:ferredoxin-type protein NapF